MAVGRVAAAALALLVLASARQAYATYTCDSGSVLAVAKAAGANSFVAAVEAAGLAGALGNASFAGTIFVPSDKAFAAAGQVPADILPSILKYHVVPNRVVPYKQLAFAGKLYTLLTPKYLLPGLTLKLQLRIVGETNYVSITQPDIYAKKAIVHIVSGVLIPKLPKPCPPPPSPPPPPPPPACASVLDLVLATPDLSVLGQLAVKAGLDKALADKSLQATIVAPTNEAFAMVPGFIGASVELLTQTLLYHIIPGPGKLAAEVVKTAGNPFNTLASVGGPLKFAVTPEGNVTVSGLTNTAMVIKTDIVACNGTVVHLIDVVLIPYYAPPPPSPPPPSPPPPPPPPACASVLDLVLATPDLSVLGQLAVQAGLDKALADKSLQATIVAPTNEAFAKVPGYVASNTAALTQTLLYHIIPGPGKLAAEVIKTAGTPFNTLASIGGPLKFSVWKNNVYVIGKTNKAEVIKTDIVACNGTVVHLINAVLIPSPKYYYG